MEFSELRNRALSRYYPKLNKRQSEAVLSTEGPLLVLAGAGSGKTTVIIHKIAHLIRFGSAAEPTELSPQDTEILTWFANGELDELPPALENALIGDTVMPWQILAITFTNKAAGELKQRLSAQLGPEGNDVYASTFHSACVRFLRRDAEKIGYDKSFTIYDTADQQTVIKECLKELAIDDKKYPPRAVISAISNAKDKLINPEEYEKLNRGDFYYSKIAQIYALYQRKLKLNNAMDFDDLIVNTIRLFEECREVLEYYQNRFKYILVDEYQIQTARSTDLSVFWRKSIKIFALWVTTIKVSTNSAVPTFKTYSALKRNLKTVASSSWKRIIARPKTFLMPQMPSYATTADAKAKSFGPPTERVTKSAFTPRQTSIQRECILPTQ